jgi:predicted amino acid-binding ACT domain protein
MGVSFFSVISSHETKIIKAPQHVFQEDLSLTAHRHIHADNISFGTLLCLCAKIIKGTLDITFQREGPQGMDTEDQVSSVRREFCQYLSGGKQEDRCSI